MILEIFLILFLSTSRASNTGEKSPAYSTFKDLTKTREFIDKSPLIRYILDHSRRHIYIAAPSGFGKSTNLRMLQEFFAMEVDSNGYSINPAKILKTDETFQNALQRCASRRNISTDRGAFVTDTKGQSVYVNVTKPFGVFGNPLKNYDTFSKPPLRIYVESPELFETQFARYPVLMLDFGTLSTMSYQDYVRSFQIMISRLFQPFLYIFMSNRLTQGCKDEFLLFRDQFKELSVDELVLGGEKLAHLLFVHHHRKSVVLVDDFDVPIRKALLAPHLDEKNFKGIMWSLSRFVELLVKSKSVFRTVVTGNLGIDVTNGLMQFSIFSDQVAYRYYGLTDDDASELAGRFAKRKNIVDASNWYSGYKAARKGYNLYNTRSTLSYFKTGELKPYRDEASKFKTLKNLLDYEKVGRDVEDALEGNTRLLIRQKIQQNHLEQLRLTIFNSNQTVVNRNLVLQILLDHGFYTAVDENKLHVPNFEALLDIKNLTFDRTYYNNKLNLTDLTIDNFVQSIELLSGEESSFHNFSVAVTELFRYRVPRGAREMAHTLLFLAAEARKFSLVCGQETPDHTRQDVLVKRSEEMGIVIGITVGPIDDEGLKLVFIRSFQVFQDCKAKVAILLGLKRRGVVGDLDVLYTYDNRTIVDRSETQSEVYEFNPTTMKSAKV